MRGVAIHVFTELTQRNSEVIAKLQSGLGCASAYDCRISAMGGGIAGEQAGLHPRFIKMVTADLMHALPGVSARSALHKAAGDSFAFVAATVKPDAQDSPRALRLRGVPRRGGLRPHV